MSLAEIKPDIVVAEDFFDFIADRDEEINFRTFDDAEMGSVKPQKYLGKIDDYSQRLSYQNQQGAGIFWVVNPTDGKGQTDSNIIGVRALFLDLDGAPLDPVLRTQALPHVILETSPGKHHAYWLITSGFPVSEFSRYQKALARRFNGDVAISNPSRVMRIPGFFHMKDRDNPFMSRSVSMIEQMPYDPQDLIEALDLKLDAADEKCHLKVVSNKDRPGVIPVGNRDNQLFRMGSHFRNGGGDYDDILAFLVKKNSALCEVPLSIRQVEKIARQVCGLNSAVLRDINSGSLQRATAFGAGSEVCSHNQEQTVSDGNSNKKRNTLSFIKTAKELETKEIEPLKWTIPDVLPQGLVILAGAPKMGKSLLIQQISYAVALGGLAMGKFPTIQGPALHLALEDSEARFKQRMELQKGLIHEGNAPEDLAYATEWSFYPNAIADIRAWCDQTPNAKIVVVDTLAKLFQENGKESRQSVYHSEYQTMTEFHKIARDYGISVVLIHHQRKADATDPMMKVSGSAGITGAADLVWNFERKSRLAMAAKVQSMGKDMPDVVYRLNYDKEHLSWICQDFGTEDNNSVVRKLLVDYFNKIGDQEVSAAEVSDAIGKHRQHVSSMLKTLEVDGFLVRRKASGNNTILYRVNRDLFVT
jgi:hypothetical protein